MVFRWYGICSTTAMHVTKAMIIGLYSGIFLMYLQYKASPKNGSKRNNILFYALCFLYVLSMATIVLDLYISFHVPAVSKNEHLV